MQPFATHQVTNQVAPLEDYSLFDTDQALKQCWCVWGSRLSNSPSMAPGWDVRTP